MPIYKGIDSTRYFWLQKFDPCTPASTFFQTIKKLVFLLSPVQAIHFHFHGASFLQTGFLRCTNSTLWATMTRIKWQRGLRGSRTQRWRSESRRRTLWRGARVSRLEDEGEPNSSPLNESKRDLATSFMVPGIEFSLDAPLAGVELKIGLLAAEDSVKAEGDLELESWIVLNWKMSR